MRRDEINLVWEDSERHTYGTPRRVSVGTRTPVGTVRTKSRIGRDYAEC